MNVPTSTAQITTVEDAVVALGEGATLLAGGSWLMRSSSKPSSVVRAALLPELGGVRAERDAVSLGAVLTHAQLAAVAPHAALRALTEAARQSAFPQARNVATLGANIANARFPEGDLVPALLAAGAELELASGDGRSTVPIAEYLLTRHARRRDELIVRVRVPLPAARTSDFVRLTVRKAGEYALASVAVSIDLNDRFVTSARVAIGSVEARQRLSPEAGQALVGSAIGDAAAIADAMAALAETLEPRDAVDGPGWYRASVTPVLLKRVVRRLTSSIA